MIYREHVAGVQMQVVAMVTRINSPHKLKSGSYQALTRWTQSFTESMYVPWQVSASVPKRLKVCSQSFSQSRFQPWHIIWRIGYRVYTQFVFHTCITQRGVHTDTGVGSYPQKLYWHLRRCVIRVWHRFFQERRGVVLSIFLFIFPICLVLEAGQIKSADTVEPLTLTFAFTHGSSSSAAIRSGIQALET